MILVDSDPEKMLLKLQNYIPPKFDKADWILEMLNKQKPAQLNFKTEQQNQ